MNYYVLDFLFRVHVFIPKSVYKGQKLTILVMIKTPANVKSTMANISDILVDTYNIPIPKAIINLMIRSICPRFVFIISKVLLKVIPLDQD
jgi:hypothetical protein